MVYQGFIGPSYRSQSVSAAGDVLINLYPEVLESQGASQSVFYGTPGISLFCTVGDAPVRGITSITSSVGQVSTGEVCFVFAGQSLYQVFANATATQVGTHAGLGGSSPVSMQTDGTNVLVAVNGQLWVYSPPGGFVQIDPTVVPGAGQVSYADGYFVVNVPGTNQFFISALFDPTSWNALDFGAKSGFPDIIVGHIIDHRELWLFGGDKTEIFWDTGAANFPWERIQGPYMEMGLGAAFSLARLDNTHFWLSADERGARQIWRANGYTPQRVSTFPIEYALGTYARVDNAVAFTYQELGHAFYVISFPTTQQIVPGQFGSATWAYDVSSNLWHQRDYIDPQFGISQRIRGWVHAYVFGMHLVGDWANGNIYIQSAGTYTDNGAPIRRLRRAPHILKEHQRIFYPGFELHIQQGVVPQTGRGSQPTFNLRKSNDGGFTWSSYMPAQAGLAGQYRNRLLWRRLGQSRDTVFEVSSDEPIQHAWVNAYLHPDPQVSPE